MKKSNLIMILLLLIAVTLIAACDSEDTRESDRRLYRVLRSEALGLYFDMYPLRVSSMGIHRCDSLLFTYSEEELKETTSRLKRLRSGFKKLSVAGLDEKEYEDSRLIARWVNGELFALENLGDNIGNPILYCWILEETLWGIPSRKAPPEEGELAAYLKRLEMIPMLLEQAERHATNPAKPHIELASALIRGQLERMPELEALIEKRYGAGAELPDRLPRSITGFLGFLDGTMSSQTRGNLLLGSENISRILRYDESMDINIGGTIEAAGKAIIRLETELGRLERSVVVTEQGTDIESDPPALEKILEKIRAGQEGDSFPGNIMIEDTGSSKSADRIPGSMMKSGNLTLHPIGGREVSLIPAGPFRRGPCALRLLAAPDLTGKELLYESLRELALARPLDMLCQGMDTVRAIFPSRIYAEVVRYIEVERLIDLFPSQRPALKAQLLEEKMRALALTVVVLRLHAGSLTKESAEAYLEETVGITAGEAARHVTAATYAPAIAYPGLSILEIEKLRKSATVRSQAVRTDERLRGILMELYFMPIPDIYQQLPNEP